MIFTGVTIQGTTLGAQTDVNGYFSITRVPAGKFNLLVTYLGYDTLTQEVEVKEGEIVTRKLYMQKSSVKLKIWLFRQRKKRPKPR